jgi:hypothetical protein
MPKRYPSDFRHRVLELVEAGRSVTEVAHDLRVSLTLPAVLRHPLPKA